MQLDEASVPVSGIVKKCPKCKSDVTVMPPSGGIGQELDLDGFMPMSPPLGDAKRGGPPPTPAGDDDMLELDPQEIIDLPAPKGPSGSDLPDLLAPVGPRPTRNSVADLPAPVGPVPTRGGIGGADSIDLPAPVGPVPTKNLPDLLAPVGPVGTKNVPDLLAPVGPVGTKNVPDLLAPVGPVGTKNVPDLLAPVGPVGTKNVPDLLAPVGPTSTKNAPELPAPKGFFDDAPPPKPGAQGVQFDELDLSPAPPLMPPGGPSSPPPMPPAGGPPRVTSAIPALDLADPGPSGGALNLDSLDLMPGGEGGKSGPGAFAAPPDAGNAGTADASVISFKPSAPGNTAPPPSSFGPAPGPAGGARAASLDLADGPASAQAKKGGTLAGGDEAAPRTAAKGRAAKELSPQAKRRRTIAMITLGAVVALGAAGFYVKQQMDKAAALKATIKTSLVETRRLLTADDADHWDKAYASAQKMLRLDGKNPDAIGLGAQAAYAAAVDTGQKIDERRKAGDALINTAVRQALDSPEIDKAKGLSSLLDSKPAEALASLQLAQKKSHGDADLLLYMGWASLDAGDAASAKSDFEQVLSRQKDRLPALFGLGRAQQALGDAAGAKATFEKVLSIRTDHVGAWVGLARMLPRDRVGTREKRFMEIVRSEHAKDAHPRDLSAAWSLAGDEALRVRRLDDASERYKQAEALDRDNLDAIVGRGFTLLAQNNSIEARKMFADVLQRRPDHLRALVGLARVELVEGHLDAAKDTMGKALAKNAEDAEVQLWYGKILEADPSGQSYENAAVAYKHSAELDPVNYEPVVALAQLYQNKMNRPADATKTLGTLSKDAESDAFLSNTLGLAYLSAGDPATAETWFRSALKIEPQNPEAHGNLGAALAARGDAAGAITEYEKAHQLDPANEPLAIRLADAYVHAKRFGDAEKLYVTMLDESSGKHPTVNARAAAGRFYARRGDLAKTVPLATSILAEDVHNPAGLFLRGNQLINDKDFQGAQKALSEAVASDPQAQYYEALGRSFEGQNSLEEAMNAYNQAVMRDKTYVEPLIDRARVHQLRHEWAEALPDLDEAKRLEPERAEPYWRTGDSLYQIGRKKDAVAPYQAALARDGKNPEIYYKLGLVYYDLDRGADVIANMRQAVAEGKPDDDWLPDAWLKLGYTYKSQGHHGEACAAFSKFDQVAPSSAVARGDVKQILIGCP
jgi:tetratricopeptide (TPR) repeat protein